MDNIISAPLDFPKIEPLNWTSWWDLWIKEAEIIRKVTKNHNPQSALWKGFDIYVAPGVNATDLTGYSSKNINCLELFPILFQNLNLLPVEVQVIRIASSVCSVKPHSDSPGHSIALRTMLYDNNFKPTFYYEFNDKKVYQTLPTETNSWIFSDHKSKHGTDYFLGHSKLLISYYGKFKNDLYSLIIDQSRKKYNDYIIYDNGS
jgi:hypothetical protein